MFIKNIYDASLFYFPRVKTFDCMCQVSVNLVFKRLFRTSVEKNTIWIKDLKKERYFVLGIYRWLLFFIEVQLAKRHEDSTSRASQLNHKINKVPLLLPDLVWMVWINKNTVAKLR